MFPAERDRAIAETTDRFWDEIARGHASDVPGVDPVDAATIVHLHAFDDRPDPASAFAKRLRVELLHVQALPVSSAPDRRTLSNGRVAQPPQIDRPLTPIQIERGRGRWMALAVVLLLLLAGVAGFWAFGPERDDRRKSIPAVFSSPDPTSPTAPPEATLLDVVVPAPILPPAGAGGSALTHAAVNAGGRATWGGPGARLAYVLGGRLTLTADGPIRLVRPDTAPIEWPPGTPVDLAAGDAVISPDGSVVDIAVPAFEPAELLAWTLTGDADDGTSIQPGWDALYTVRSAVDALTFSGRSMRMRIERVELAAGAALPPPSAGVVVRQAAATADNARGTPVSAMHIYPTGGAVRNYHDTAIDLYLVTLEPAVPPPVASPSAVP